MHITNIPCYKIWETHQLNKTQRGDKGFGSTGRTSAFTKVISTHRVDNKGITYNINKKLEPKQYIQLEELLNEYRADIMATSFEELEGKHPLHEHDIDTGDAKPFKCHLRPLPKAREAWMPE